MVLYSAQTIALAALRRQARVESARRLQPVTNQNVAVSRGHALERINE